MKHTNLKITALLLTLGLSLVLCSCGGERLYTEKQFLEALENRYDYEFIIIDSEKISGNAVKYTVALKDDPDTVFEVTNELRTSGSDIGPHVNSIKSNDLLYYSIGPDAYEGYKLDKAGELDSDQDNDLVCYKMTDEVWKRDKKAEKPDYIVYNIHPGKY